MRGRKLEVGWAVRDLSELYLRRSSPLPSAEAIRAFEAHFGVTLPTRISRPTRPQPLARDEPGMQRFDDLRQASRAEGTTPHIGYAAHDLSAKSFGDSLDVLRHDGYLPFLPLGRLGGVTSSSGKPISRYSRSITNPIAPCLVSRPMRRRKSFRSAARRSMASSLV